jgi:hypothetical protein
MIKRLLPALLVLISVISVQAQQTRIPYTSNNNILISLEGPKGTYEFSSGMLLVRYNENTRRVECLLPLSNLLPTNDSTPAVMVQDVFFTSRYPDIYIEIDAPVEKINSGNRSRQSLNTRLYINIQGITREMVTPVTFTPDQNTISFSSSFDIMLQEMRLKVPARYTPLLTGRILFTIHNARWADLKTR